MTSIATVARSARRFRSFVAIDPLLFLMVFSSGVTVMATEMSASRLLAPYFGTSLLIWAVLIGLILLYLTIGYFLGGRLADRFPSRPALFKLTTVAGALIVLIPIVSRPILMWSAKGFANLSASIFLGSLAGTVLLFAAPVILLGCVSPWAIRLSIKDVSATGSTVGSLYALDTIGSLVGTFLPVLVLIPTIGTRATLWASGLFFIIISLVGLTREIGKRTIPYGAVLATAVVLIVVFRGGEIRAASPGQTMIFEDESQYNYIQVVRTPDNWTELVLNEGMAVHSVYNPNYLLTGGPWDYFSLAPLFRPDGISTPPKRALVIGLGGGTVPREYSHIYPRTQVDGVEIDPEIVAVGKKYFAMDVPQLHTIVQDGRYYLLTTNRKYDVIDIDAYQQPYIPFYMATREFFELTKQHLRPGGAVAINVGRAPGDFRLVNALANTMRSVYPSVFIINTKQYDNSIVVATSEPMTLAQFRDNAERVTNPDLRTVVDWAFRYGNIRTFTGQHKPFTDDLAPVEQLIDNMIIDYAVKDARP